MSFYDSSIQEPAYEGIVCAKKEWAVNDRPIFFCTDSIHHGRFETCPEPTVMDTNFLATALLSWQPGTPPAEHTARQVGYILKALGKQLLCRGLAAVARTANADDWLVLR